MASRQQKQAVIRQLLIPIILIIAALLYRPVRGWFNPGEGTIQTQADGDQLTVSYIDVGQGDATLIRKGDFSMLIDAGKNEKGSTVIEYLKKAGIAKLTVLVGTHPDSDHIGGLDDVLKQFPVETVYLPEATKETKTYHEVEEALVQADMEAQMPEIGKEYLYDSNVMVRFLGPQQNYSGANDNSLVVQLAYGSSRFLFMGDAEQQSEQDILERGYDLECDVLKVGHHGSYTATSNDFLQASNPTYAVISCGADNSYGHPHAEVLAKLEDEDVQIYRTDTMGSITAVSDGKQVHLSTEAE